MVAHFGRLGTDDLGFIFGARNSIFWFDYFWERPDQLINHLNYDAAIRCFKYWQIWSDHRLMIFGNFFIQNRMVTAFKSPIFQEQSN